MYSPLPANIRLEHVTSESSDAAEKLACLDRQRCQDNQSVTTSNIFRHVERYANHTFFRLIPSGFSYDCSSDPRDKLIVYHLGMLVIPDDLLIFVPPYQCASKHLGRRFFFLQLFTVGT